MRYYHMTRNARGDSTEYLVLPNSTSHGLALGWAVSGWTVNEAVPGLGAEPTQTTRDYLRRFYRRIPKADVPAAVLAEFAKAQKEVRW